MIVVQLSAILLGLAAMVAGIHVASRWPALARQPPRRRSARSVPAELERCQQLVGSLSSAGDVHHRLRPALRDVASVQLGASGIRLDTDSNRARARLGEELWDLVRPERPAPKDRHAPGISRSDLSRLLDRLEQL